MSLAKTSKEDIIKKAYKVFRIKGYHNTSIADLAEACQIHNAHFYYYFKNKEDLMGEVLIFVKDYLIKNFSHLIDNDLLTPKQKLSKMKSFFEQTYHHDNGGCIMANTTLELAFFEPSFLPIIKDFFEKLFDLLSKLLITQYQENKARELAEAIIQDIEGGIMLMKLYKNNKYLLNALNRAEKLLD
ncbi:MAG: TetR/AcrR family transcriptional regulator [Cytophagales bacterium]|nr:MAG: TetR/AcrR family transcriptional regulator [Cytophagales bacterium]